MCSNCLNKRGHPPTARPIMWLRHKAKVIHDISWHSALAPNSMKLYDTTIVFRRFFGFFLSPVVNSSRPIIICHGLSWLQGVSLAERAKSSCSSRDAPTISCNNKAGSAICQAKGSPPPMSSTSIERRTRFKISLLAATNEDFPAIGT